MRRIVGVLVAGVLLAAVGLVSPASAHFIDVNNPGKGNVDTHRGVPFDGLPFGWVGGDGMPAHFGGLNVACESVRGNPSVVDIWGPGGPNCPHGS